MIDIFGIEKNPLSPLNLYESLKGGHVIILIGFIHVIGYKDHYSSVIIFDNFFMKGIAQYNGLSVKRTVYRLLSSTFQEGIVFVSMRWTNVTTEI